MVLMDVGCVRSRVDETIRQQLLYDKLALTTSAVAGDPSAGRKQ
jgi:hypothetical protein